MFCGCIVFIPGGRAVVHVYITQKKRLKKTFLILLNKKKTLKTRAEFACDSFWYSLNSCKSINHSPVCVTDTVELIVDHVVHVAWIHVASIADHIVCRAWATTTYHTNTVPL